MNCKLLISFLVITGLLAGCTKKTDNLFDKTVDERLSEALTNYQTALTSAPGWKLFVYPKGLESQDIKVGGLSYYLKFAANNRVTMVSDFLPTLAATTKESGYRLKALQRPSLIFDTYSYMHIPADPDPNVSFSPTGSGGYGWGTDFNFSFTEVAVKDTMVLKGNFNKSEAVLVKATQAEMDAAFTRGRLRDIINLSYDYPNNNPFLYFQASSSQKAAVGFDFNNVIITFSTLEGTTIVNKSMAFSFTTYGIHLMMPVTIGSYTFQDIYWDDAKKIYYILAGTTHIEFANSPTPLISLSLTNVIGSQFTTISVPPGAGLPFESNLFFTRYNAFSTGILNGPYALTLDDMDFVFNAGAKTMTVNAYLYQFGVGPYVAQYYYTYTVDGSGNFKFTKAANANGNGALIQTNANNILSYIESDQFKLDGFATSSAFLGRFTSNQTPAFYFTGYLY
ncbi:MAG: DUF4302 domain-containing protein [Williamsia sp.]|nr:DUF4302 domain-containing protein [Williamsia sp.]